MVTFNVIDEVSKNFDEGTCGKAYITKLNAGVLLLNEIIELAKSSNGSALAGKISECRSYFKDVEGVVSQDFNLARYCFIHEIGLYSRNQEFNKYLSILESDLLKQGTVAKSIIFDPLGSLNLISQILGIK